MTATLWFLLGAFIGVDAALTYAWLTTRRKNRSVVGRVSLYTDPEPIWKAAVLRDFERHLQRRRQRNSTQMRGTLTFDTPAARRALQRRRPW